MKYWDSSALLPLIVTEAQSRAKQFIYSGDSHVFSWWATRVELLSALARRRHSGEWSDEEFQSSIRRWQRLVERFQDVAPSDRVRETAERLLVDHQLRAADSLQLAAAIVLRQNAVEPFDFVTLDTRLGQAATAEGFRVLPA